MCPIKVGDYIKLNVPFEEVNAWNLAAAMGALATKHKICCTDHEEKKIIAEVIEQKSMNYGGTRPGEKYLITLTFVKLNVCEGVHCILIDERDCTFYPIGILKAAKSNK